MTTALILAKENRIMINDIKAEINKLSTKMEEIFNHMSDRLPSWATALIAGGGSIITGLIVLILKSQ